MARAEIRARATLDRSGFDASIASIKGSVSQLKGLFAGAFSIGAVAGLTSSIVKMGSDIKDAADAAGLIVEQYQAFSRAVLEAGGNAQKADSILTKLAAAQASIGTDTKLQDAMARIGISISDVTQATLPEFIEMLSRNKALAADFGAMLELVGIRNVGTFRSAIREMTGSLEAYQEQLKKSGAIMSGPMAAELDMLDSRVNKLTTTFKVRFAQGVNLAIDLVKANIQSLGAAVEGKNPFDAFAQSMRESNSAMRDSQKATDSQVQELQQAEQQARATAQAEAELTAANEAAQKQEKEREDEYKAGLKDRIAAMAEKNRAVIQQQSSLEQMAGEIFRGQGKDPQRYDELRRMGANALGAGNATRPEQRTLEEIRNILKEQLAEAKKTNPGATLEIGKFVE